MPVYQDSTTKTWYVKCYYTDYTGTKHQRKKRGFKLQREAKEWERNFLETQQAELTMTFENFVEVYCNDMQHRLRENTFRIKKHIIDTKIMPYFGQIPVCQITPASIRRWQNELTAYKDKNGKGYSGTYLKCINNQLVAIINYADKYYSLKDNPCRRAGSMGKSRAKEMQIWTVDEFKVFLANISDNPVSRAAFLLLYYTGIRPGELLALEYGDIDFDCCRLSINKSCQRIHGHDVITPPKTDKGIRTISIPEFLRDELKAYASMLYALGEHDRLFTFLKTFLYAEMSRGTSDGTVKSIRVYDLRHSHVSLLIDLGFSAVAIADRLGHESADTTMRIYAHLFPQRRDEIADKLQSCI